MQRSFRCDLYKNKRFEVQLVVHVNALEIEQTGNQAIELTAAETWKQRSGTQVDEVRILTEVS